MKTSLLFLFVLSLLLLLPNQSKAEQIQDSLHPCWAMEYPNEPQNGDFNPDSVMLDTCLCKRPHWLYPCKFVFAKKWFKVFLPYKALLIPEAPYDTIIDKTWRDIDTTFIDLRYRFSEIETQFGAFILRKEFPEDIDSISQGSRCFNIKFENYVKIDTVENFLLNIKDIDFATYIYHDVTYNTDVLFLEKYKNIVSISPNPVSDYLYITLHSELPHGKIEIYSIEGIKILETEAVNRIDVSSLSPGVYFVKYGSKVAKFLKM